MVKFIIAKELVGKKVVSTSGYDIGRLVDAEISQVTGKISYVVIEPSSDSSLAKKLSSSEGPIRMPYSAVTSVADYVVIDTKNM